MRSANESCLQASTPEPTAFVGPDSTE